MKINMRKNNALIKRKNLSLAIKKAGIKRVSPDAILLLDYSIRKLLESLLGALKEETLIQGRKTLKASDIKKVIAKLKKRTDFWEV